MVFMKNKCKYCVQVENNSQKNKKIEWKKAGRKQEDGALSGTRTHATGFGDLYSIQLSYERF